MTNLPEGIEPTDPANIQHALAGGLLKIAGNVPGALTYLHEVEQILLLRQEEEHPFIQPRKNINGLASSLGAYQFVDSALDRPMLMNARDIVPGTESRRLSAAGKMENTLSILTFLLRKKQFELPKDFLNPQNSTMLAANASLGEIYKSIWDPKAVSPLLRYIITLILRPDAVFNNHNTDAGFDAYLSIVGTADKGLASAIPSLQFPELVRKAIKEIDRDVSSAALMEGIIDNGDIFVKPKEDRWLTQRADDLEVLKEAVTLGVDGGLEKQLDRETFDQEMSAILGDETFISNPVNSNSVENMTKLLRSGLSFSNILPMQVERIVNSPMALVFGTSGGGKSATMEYIHRFIEWVTGELDDNTQIYNRSRRTYEIIDPFGIQGRALKIEFPSLRAVKNDKPANTLISLMNLAAETVVLGGNGISPQKAKMNLPSSFLMELPGGTTKENMSPGLKNSMMAAMKCGTDDELSEALSYIQKTHALTFSSVWGLFRVANKNIHGGIYAFPETGGQMAKLVRRKRESEPMAFLEKLTVSTEEDINLHVKRYREINDPSQSRQFGIDRIRQDAASRNLSSFFTSLPPEMAETILMLAAQGLSLSFINLPDIKNNSYSSLVDKGDVGEMHFRQMLHVLENVKLARVENADKTSVSTVTSTDDLLQAVHNEYPHTRKTTKKLLDLLKTLTPMAGQTAEHIKLSIKNLAVAIAILDSRSQ